MELSANLHVADGLSHASCLSGVVLHGGATSEPKLARVTLEVVLPRRAVASVVSVLRGSVCWPLFRRSSVPRSVLVTVGVSVARRSRTMRMALPSTAVALVGCNDESDFWEHCPSTVRRAVPSSAPVSLATNSGSYLTESEISGAELGRRGTDVDTG